MIITDRFTCIHQPKTGGTFVSSVLFRVHCVPWNRLIQLLSTIKTDLTFKTRYGQFVFHNNKHGICGQIPARHVRPRILASIRNPYDQLVSQYEFGWWKRRSCRRFFRTIPNFKKNFPHFPDITFAEFVELSDQAFWTTGSQPTSLGYLSREFVHYYFRAPAEVLSRIDDEYLAARQFQKDTYPVHFLRQDSLNRDLFDFLVAEQYRPEDLEFILGLGKILPGGVGRGPEQRWERYYTPELKSRVRRRERLLFSMFPEFDDKQSNGVEISSGSNNQAINRNSSS